MKRLAWLLAAVVLAVFIFGGLVFLLLPRDSLKTRIAEQISAWTGRDVSVRGSPVITLFPGINIKLADVQIAGPPEMKDAELVSMDSLKATIRILPLLIGRVEIASFTMVRPHIQLVRDERARRNWDFDSGAAALQLAFSGDVPLGEFLIQDGTILYTNRASRNSDRLDAVNVGVGWSSVRRPLSLEGSAVWRGENIRIDARADRPFAFLRRRATPIEADIKSTLLNLDFKGEASGVRQIRLNGSLDLSTPSLRGFVGWTGGSIGQGSGLGAASLSGTANYTEDKLSFDDARLVLDGNRAQGAIRLAFGRKPAITGTLASEKVDLTSYVVALAPGAFSKTGSWRDVAINASWLGMMDADIRVSAGTVTAGAFTLTDAAATLGLRNGQLELGLAQSTFCQGTLAGDLSASAAANGKLQVGSVLRASGFDLAQAAPSLHLPQGIRGKASMRANLTSGGSMLSELVTGLAGTADASAQKASLPSIGLAELLQAERAGKSNQPIPATGLVDADSVSLPMTFGDGKAHVAGATSSAPDYAVETTGDITLLDGGLNMTGKVTPSAAPGTAVPFLLTGTVAHPVVQRSANPVVPKTVAPVPAAPAVGETPAAGTSQAPAMNPPTSLPTGPTPTSPVPMSPTPAQSPLATAP
ncbi:Uncharacterized protein involved in outer membrane biogenesis [Faunimonas pinastri]|uniref:Uncharacterized protein involved in outer membrane biogenesis n=1 Tax=Faunimonas pinastri TaxID=1855383 RepID=A0A1H9M3A2_9HYPH|nr:AsmA family protein [Faunimonas pinastri]SER18172.1 Uncharacterized protein involved in outer membrane biogenesis [Faunimonas pinastri]